ncbi:uncharacterized protein BJ212DRAFT_550394 [Suillus subaureus]|uniref:Uncharacterized protein n=1 Tax=Suillus subaureus TaxID=48587 RepID=A0A9P7EMF8_9AGAM|nr:uncharacterized protein BJ212DRAFT_550394 [Suillus subaureus]KAG1824858.1 hypothetical protein BJ212DRAFT_550394 [Suillus subaureus]
MIFDQSWSRRPDGFQYEHVVLLPYMSIAIFLLTMALRRVEYGMTRVGERLLTKCFGPLFFESSNLHNFSWLRNLMCVTFYLFYFGHNVAMATAFSAARTFLEAALALFHQIKIVDATTMAALPSTLRGMIDLLRSKISPKNIYHHSE